MSPARNGRPRVVIAGGGVAAVETLLALRDLAGPLVSIELLAPERDLVHRPASVALPFGLGAPAPLDVDALAGSLDAHVRRAALAGADPDRRVAVLAGGEEVPYDMLVVTVGAVPRPALAGAHTFAGPDDVPELQRLLDAAERGELRRLAFVLPRAVTWPLPLYELAVMAAIDLRDRGVTGAEVSVLTAEREPLWLFGAAAAHAVREMLAARSIALRTGARAHAVQDGHLLLDSGEAVAADAVVAPPELEGPRVLGLPVDAGGFIPVDLHGRVRGLADVYAAGDATSFPVKQGGLATQQADAVAEAIAERLGARDHAQPFRPVLRGLLLTGGAPLYLRAELSPTGEVEGRSTERPPAAAALRGEASGRALWWPPGKVAGRYIAPYLATARPVRLGMEPLTDRSPSGATAAPDHEEAVALALLMADEDARLGDHRQALQALDAAMALAGGALPAGYAARRAEWQRELAHT